MSDQNKGPESPLTKEPSAPLDAYMDLWAAIERSGFDLSPCMQCGEAVVCIPDGLAMCLKCVEKCAEKAGGE